jgi:predicted regulator of Ras-like GTPase activity (Roadblock/LC7/MglB family)
MSTSDIEAVLQALLDDNDDVLLAMLVSNEGLSLCHAGSADDFDTAGALYIELKLICGQVLQGLAIGELEHIFVRARHGCVEILPAGNLGVLACMTRSTVNTSTLHITVWKYLSALRKVKLE